MIKNLVFEGGGVKGIAYGGALIELERLGYLNSIECVAGTSAGAITAMLMAIGISPTEISQIINEMKFSYFADDTLGVIRDIWRLATKFGWHKGKELLEWVSEQIKSKQGKADLTFGELRSKSDSKSLYIVGTNLSKLKSEIYSYEHTPTMAIRDAVRISMSIPFYFQPVKQSVLVDGRIKKSVLVDGGVTCNYPLTLFDNVKYVSNKNGIKVKYNNDPNYVYNKETLGFRLDSRDEILYNKKGWENSPKEITNIVKFTTTLISFIMETANKKHLHKNDWKRTIFIDTLGVKATDFDLNREVINDLVESGKQGVTDYFMWRDGLRGGI